MYYYVKNLQGDIVKIVKQDGSVAATYTYDAWGKLLSVKDGSNVNVPASKPFHVANLNPYRYRGYIYDTETGLYYLQSRYYDPITGRFVNADDTQFIKSQVLSSNLYTYCLNNPVIHLDGNGKSPLTFALESLGFQITGAAAHWAINNSMTIQFYAHAYINRELNKVYDFSDNDMYKDKIKKTSLYKNFVNKYLNNLNKYLEMIIHRNEIYFSKTAELNYNDKSVSDYNIDLHYAIGWCTATIVIKKLFSCHFATNVIRGYSVQVSITDYYNFEVKEWNGITSYINNILGYAPQESAMLIPYYWHIDFDYYNSVNPYIFVCKHGG